MEDVCSKYHAPRNGYNNVASVASSAHQKSSFRPSVDAGGSLTVIESEEEHADTVKQRDSKWTKITSLREKPCRAGRKGQTCEHSEGEGGAEWG